MNCPVENCSAQVSKFGCPQHSLSSEFGNWKQFTLADLKYERHLMDAAEPQHSPTWRFPKPV